MGSSHSIQLQEDEIMSIIEETGFSRNQVIRIYNRFLKLDKNDKGYISEEDFRRIPEFTVNPLCDRLIDIFMRKKVLEDETVADQDGINFREFINVISTFRTYDNMESHECEKNKNKKLKFIFDIYDVSSDNLIDRQDITNILNLMVGSTLSNEQFSQIVDRTMAELNMSKDKSEQYNSINFQDFKKVLETIDLEEKMSVKFRG
ncbi:Calcineurin B [Intoshia linei]|uniref:Calcineurin B n=1 Tax=Intoshia linei TaxID=1819745 RepID=A0A177B5N2_9BILA|nr:Calcineurin B [Intoshia linei]